jgi:hypothetical protein
MNVGQKLDSAVIGDVNGDGKLDLVAVGTAPALTTATMAGATTRRTRQASVLLGDGQEAFHCRSLRCWEC